MRTSVQGAPTDKGAERATLGAVLITGDARVATGLLARGLRPEHFYWSGHSAVFRAIASLADRASGVDPITVIAEMDRLGSRGDVSRGDVEGLMVEVPASGNYADYADRVIELAEWRGRQRALHELQESVTRRDTLGYMRAKGDLDSAIAGTRTESYSAPAWGSLMFDHFNNPKAAVEAAIALPFPRLTDAMGGGLQPGEWCALSGPTGMGKSAFVDQWLDHAADRGHSCHLYMTEMTAISRGMRLLSRRAGVPFMRQRRGDLSSQDMAAIMAEIDKFPFGCSVAADWNVDDIVRDALRARYDFVVVDLLHGFHYEDERGLDRLSKAVQRLARTSTTLDGHRGTAVVAVCHLKEEGMVRGRIPRPSISSIKGGSSIKQDADFVCFVWQDQDPDQGGATTGAGEVWLAKGRSGELARQDVQLNAQRFRFEVRSDDGA